MKDKHLIQDDTGYSHVVDVVVYDGSNVVWEINVYDDICDVIQTRMEKGVSIKWGVGTIQRVILESYSGTDQRMS